MFAAPSSSAQPTLFPAAGAAAPIPPYADDVITAEEEAELVRRFAELEFAPFAFHGFEGKRRVVSFGWGYDFSRSRPYRTDPPPAWLEPLRARAAAWAGLQPQALQQVSVLEYSPGAPIGWHRDRPIYEDVVGVSLLAPRTLRLRQRWGSGFRRAALTLKPRSIYLLRGEVRDAWEHSIPAGDDLRYSVMFRSLRANHPAHIAAA